MSEESITEELKKIFTAEALDDMTTLWASLHPIDASFPSCKSLQERCIVAHKFRGAALNYGYMGLARYGEMMETVLEYVSEIDQTRWPEAVDFLRAIVGDCRSQIDRIANGGKDDGRAADAWSPRYAALIPFESPSDASTHEAQTATTGNSISAEYCVPTIDAEILSYFVPEIQDYLETIKKTMVRLRSNPSDNDEIHTLFRTVHTIKGSAYTVGFSVIGDLVHPLEDCLVTIRDGGGPVTHVLLDVVDRTMDIVRSLLRRDPSDVAGFQQDILIVKDTLRRIQEGEPVEIVVVPNDSVRPVVVETAQILELTAEYIIPELDSTDLSYFLPEAEGYLQIIENLLLQLEKDPKNQEMANQLFGNVHTLKGSAYTVNFQIIGDLVHTVEDYLDAVRHGRLEITTSFTDIVLRAIDAVRVLLKRDVKQLPRLKERLLRVRSEFATLGQASAPGSIPRQASVPMVETAEELPADSSPEPREGTPLPDSDVTAAPSDISEIRVRKDRLEQLLNLVGELIINRGRLERRLETMSQLTHQVMACKNRLLTGIQAFEEKYTFTLPSLSPQEIGGSMPALTGMTEFGELEFDKYDDFNILARRVGEGAADISESVMQLNGSIQAAREEMNQLQELTTGIRDHATKARMVSIGMLFTRFLRSVRESARVTGKDVAMVMAGERTEIDTGVVEQLIDPLIHLMRNAVYHGIEPAQVREANGKPAIGTIRLHAAQRGNAVVIEVEDDGHGLDLDKIKTTAVAKGMVNPDLAAKLTDTEITRFIFVPGFSTADVSTDQAGRGIGMDVVERVIRSMNGRIEIDTVKGRGTKFSLHLPLTLLITMALIVRAGEARYAIPLASIREITLAMPSAVQNMGNRMLLQVGDEAVEIQVLSSLLGHGSSSLEITMPIVIVHTDAGPMGIAVDELLGQQEIVVKSLGSLKLMEHVAFSGATFDLDGRVILVLDVSWLFTTQSAGVSMIARSAAPELGAGDRRSEAASDPEPAKIFSILLIDDSLSIRKFIGRMLEAAGYRVTTAGDGEEGIRKSSMQAYSVIITDLEMPKLNGYEVIQALRSRQQTQSVPILVMTTRAGEKHRQLALNVGATGYITKPVEERTLLKEIERVAGGNCLSKP
jgi:chemosensory pili system protein ChpA (sensor histidine kinase/response regulator)